jgi:hypothetical protein
LNSILGLGQTETGKTGEKQAKEHAHHLRGIKGIADKEFVLPG